MSDTEGRAWAPAQGAQHAPAVGALHAAAAVSTGPGGGFAKASPECTQATSSMSRRITCVRTGTSVGSVSSRRPARVSSVNGTARYSVPSSNHESSHDDRRGPHRPANGDRRPCRSCGEMMRFLEWYEVTHARVTVTLPAWVCSCGDETFVRPGPFDRRTGGDAPGRPPSRSNDPR